ncbi:hypothetical protein QG37_03917 [Candidozyma auris]|nr:hypothetical protein QG37_03917 [[Candida] auris]
MNRIKNVGQIPKDGLKKTKEKQKVRKPTRALGSEDL